MNSTVALPADPVLAEHATAIRALAKNVVRDVIEIGRHLTEAKAKCGHGNWLPWLEREFRWTDKTAERFMSVHALAGKFDNLSNLEVSVSALYLLAAPSTPPEIRDDVLARAGAGEAITHADVRGQIDDARATEDDEPAQDQTAGRFKKWQLSLALFCVNILNRRHIWDQDIPGWRLFECSSEIRTLLERAAAEIAALNAMVKRPAPERKRMAKPVIRRKRPKAEQAEADQAAA